MFICDLLVHAATVPASEVGDPVIDKCDECELDDLKSQHYKRGLKLYM